MSVLLLVVVIVSFHLRLDLVVPQYSVPHHEWDKDKTREDSGDADVARNTQLAQRFGTCRSRTDLDWKQERYSCALWAYSCRLSKGKGGVHKKS